MPNVSLPVLFTDSQGTARFTEFPIELKPVNDTLNLSDVFEAGGVQFRLSVPGAGKDFHCTERKDCQLVIVQSGVMRIGLRDGSYRDFKAGEEFLSMDFVPAGESFDPLRHGHTSREVTGKEPLRTLFVKVDANLAERLLGFLLMA